MTRLRRAALRPAATVRRSGHCNVSLPQAMAEAQSAGSRRRSLRSEIRDVLQRIQELEQSGAVAR